MSSRKKLRKTLLLGGFSDKAIFKCFGEKLLSTLHPIKILLPAVRRKIMDHEL